MHSHSHCDSSLGFNIIDGHTKNECTAVLVRWNRDEKISKVTNKNRANELTDCKGKNLSARNTTRKHN